MAAVTRKPKRDSQEGNNPVESDEAVIKAVVDKGGSVAKSSAQVEVDRQAVQVVNLRVPVEILNEIDSLRKERRIKTPRHTWLLEAIEEKIEREHSL